MSPLNRLLEIASVPQSEERLNATAAIQDTPITRNRTVTRLMSNLLPLELNQAAKSVRIATA